MGKNDFGDGASPGKIFIGGLATETTLEQFVKYFEKYGEIIDSVIMKDRHTGRPRGFGFITYADPTVVDTVIAENHIINDKQVEIKRTIPKGSSADSKDFKTKKIFVGGIPTTMTEGVAFRSLGYCILRQRSSRYLGPLARRHHLEDLESPSLLLLITTTQPENHI
ncbi:hypothetical protein BC332_18862 [Capsicum chinense]|nr:hypothetical protein BC332_18862 [Capsicum chinense]